MYREARGGSWYIKGCDGIRKELILAINQGNVLKFYKSKDWKKKRKDILDRDNNECQKCKRRGGFSKATCVHHKKHLKEYPELGLTDSNLESLCDACHNEEHSEKLHKEIKKPLTEERW